MIGVIRVNKSDDLTPAQAQELDEAERTVYGPSYGRAFKRRRGTGSHPLHRKQSVASYVARHARKVFSISLRLDKIIASFRVEKKP